MLCAYEALHADNRPITDPSGRPFRSTSYTAAEAKARAHNGLVKQIGASEHPPMGIVAAVLAEDEARTERTNTALNTPVGPPSAPPSAPSAPPSAVANEAAEDRQTSTPAPETSSPVKPPKTPKAPKTPKPPKAAGEPARATRKPKATSITAVSG